jgi:hypothetical protein
MRIGASVLVASLALCVPAAGAAPPLYEHLDPGGPANLPERVPVNVVFVGFDLSEAEQAEFLAGLPKRSKPIVRSRLHYDELELLGLHYAFDYELFTPTRAWEDAFFGQLADIAEPARRTVFQDSYNDQRGVRDVGKNHFVDAPSVEKWLIEHAPPGVDTVEDTVFFVNWWGRDDFVDHVYTKFGEPDPDTGYDFGRRRESRKIVAWGGTTADDEETGLGDLGVNRVWFYDLSAGPESWGGSYDVENADLDGGSPDYRIPPAWEYAPAATAIRPSSRPISPW